MNRIFTLAVFLLVSTAVFANRNQSRLSITSMSKAPIKVLIDGRLVQEYDNTIYVNNIQPGNHRVQIYRVDRNERNDNWNRGRGNNQYGQLIYNSNIQVRRGMHTDIIISRFGRVFLDEQPIDNRYDNDGNWNDDRWNNDNNDRRGNNGWGQPMNGQLFEQLKQTVQREAFDERKLDIVRSALTNNRISSLQVKQLMQELSFEKNKLELAKYAYRYTVDRNNYFTVNDALLFSNSKTELTRYITTYRD